MDRFLRVYVDCLSHAIKHGLWCTQDGGALGAAQVSYPLHAPQHLALLLIQDNPQATTTRVIKSVDGLDIVQGIDAWRMVSDSTQSILGAKEMRPPSSTIRSSPTRGHQHPLFSQVTVELCADAFCQALHSSEAEESFRAGLRIGCSALKASIA